MEKKFNRFSVPLGLLDYINPILYTITMVTVIRNTRETMDRPYWILLLIGAVISILAGFVIPTGKVLVGMGKIKFVMPVPLVFCVNAGILLSGLMLFLHVINPGLILFLVLIGANVSFLWMTYSKGRKLNTVAVLTGAAGYLLLYISLIVLSIQKGVAVFMPRQFFCLLCCAG